ncbi:MAG: hypothetical protein PWP46_819 [Fusobacteriaceae bacterium]|jgi:DNA-binding HxlR family transcriptional regulator|nr:hypothetical protein [Fusobacteriaceae bacterium]
MWELNGKKYNCCLHYTLDVLGGKWKSLILWHISNGTIRFGELKNLLPGISKKVLSEQLKIIENNGLITRNVYPEIPPRVEYTLTEKGKSLVPILQMMSKWANEQKTTS